MTTTLITGANKGLGFETARRLIAAGHTVYVGSRDAERGHRAAERLAARMVLIDVTDDASVATAAKTIEAEGGLDVLVNNAGIEVRNEGSVVPSAAEITADLMRSLFETNGNSHVGTARSGRGRPPGPKSPARSGDQEGAGPHGLHGSRGLSQGRGC